MDSSSAGTGSPVAGYLPGHRLAPMLAPRSVALVGASTVPSVAGNDMVLELQVSRYPGRVFPVNPRYDEVEGYRCYPGLADLPQVPDLAVLGIGNAGLESHVARRSNSVWVAR